MLDGNDRNTFHAIRTLRDLVREGNKPVVFWIGAGTSKWCGYPLWEELADSFHHRFLRREAAYDKVKGLQCIQSRDFPGLFQLCKQTNRHEYYSFLADSFAPRESTPVYRRFIELLSKIQPLFILSTNVDENLEKHLHAASTIQQPNLERIIDLIHRKSSFVCKLHGTVSAVESTVFTTDEYSRLAANQQYLAVLKHVFTQSSVVFVGNSLGDDYVISLLLASDSHKPIFGTGPHFAVLPKDRVSLPTSVLKIRYIAETEADHRSPLTVLDIIKAAQDSPYVKLQASHEERKRDDQDFESSFYIADFYPPGNWASSQTVQAKPEDGDVATFIVGQGFVDAELPSKVSPAMHDLTVGLICFDKVYMPLISVVPLHQYLGSERFWNLVMTDTISFVQLPRNPSVTYRHLTAYSEGSIVSIGIVSETGSPQTVSTEIRRYLKSVSGKEAQAEDSFESLEKKVVVADENSLNRVPDLVRGTLLHPSVRESLGISDSVVPNSIPRWNVFPMLRLAHLIGIGVVCRDLRIVAAKIGFGGQALVGPAFSVAAAQNWADDAASYVLSGRFNTDLGTFVENNPTILDAVLRFRDTQESIELRKQIRQQLSTNAAADFVASVNAGLVRTIPAAVLQKSRDQLSGLLIATGSSYRVTPAVWNNLRNSDHILSLWRKQSARLLEEYCKAHKIKPYDLCPCRSGDKLHFCCARALKV